MSELQIKYVPLDSLKPYGRNARTHSPAQIELIKRSMVTNGWTTPMGVADGTLIYGHARRLAAIALRDDGKAIRDNADPQKGPVVDLSHLSPAERRAYVIADNRSAELAGWDPALLRMEIADLGSLGFDTALTGFTMPDLERMFGPERHEGLTDPDDAPEAPADPVSVLGDVWLLGRHRLLCGDSTSATDVSRVLAGVKPHLMVTDPPYGVEYDPDWRNRADRANGRPYGARAIGVVENDTRADWSESYSLFPGDVAYVWHPAGARQVEFFASLVASGFDVRMQIIWAKSHFPIGRGNYHVQHEPCWYAVRKGKTGHWAGDRKQTTLWQIPKPEKSETGHSTQKPVECMRRPIENNSSPGQAVYEPFSGSGTTIIAAEMTGRVCHAIELSPAYVDVAVKRWQAFTGQQATRDGDGRTFDQSANALG